MTTTIRPDIREHAIQAIGDSEGNLNAALDLLLVRMEMERGTLELTPGEVVYLLRALTVIACELVGEEWKGL